MLEMILTYGFDLLLSLIIFAGDAMMLWLLIAS